MAKKCFCSLCKRNTDEEASSILTISRYGNPRYLCPACAALFDTALLGREYEAIEAAFSEIGKTMEAGNVEDELVIDEVGEILSSAKERAEAIREGGYDFALDGEEPTAEALPEPDITPEDIIEIPEETDEERALREVKEKRGAMLEAVITWSFTIGFVVGFAIFIISRFI